MTENASVIRLDQFLQIAGIVGTGGQAKLLIQNGEIEVNGEVETRRRRQLQRLDQIRFDGQDFLVEQHLDDRAGDDGADYDGAGDEGAAG